MRLALTACLMLAVPAWGHGDLHERIEAVTALIAQSPQQGALYLERAGLHAAHEEYEAAAADYERAESLNADPLLVWLGRGKVHLATGRAKEARDTLDQLLAREPRHVEALVTRARARAALRDAGGAAADFTAAIAASARPEPEYFLERAAALASSVPPDWEAAIQGLDEGLAKLGPGIATLQLAAIDLETKAGRLDAAIARLDRARAGAARQETWLVRRGDLLAMANRPTEAAAAYQAALAAIANLPPRARNTRAITELESRARQALASTSR
jgi:predicted Zn-dependent protease